MAKLTPELIAYNACVDAVHHYDAIIADALERRNDAARGASAIVSGVDRFTTTLVLTEQKNVEKRKQYQPQPRGRV